MPVLFLCYLCITGKNENTDNIYSIAYMKVLLINGSPKKEGNTYIALAEVAKYTFKDREIFRKDEALMDKLVGVLAVALKNRRLYAFGGVMKKAAKEIGMEQPGEGDLVHIEEDEIRTDVATMIEVYRWNFGVANYVRD